MKTLLTVFLLLASHVAAAATCETCEGRRVVGTGPVRHVCPKCDGTGTTADPEATAQENCVPRAGVVRVETSDGPSTSSGSGILVKSSESHGIVLTNWHVVRTHRHGVRVCWPGGSKVAGKVVKWDDAWDLAAIVVEAPPVRPVAVSAKAPHLGDVLTIAGYGPSPHRYREESGACSKFLSPTGSHPRELIEVKATARQGDSGGPIFNADGEVAGVLFGSKPGMTIGPSSTRIRAFMSDVKLPGNSAAVGVKCENGRCGIR